MATKKKLIMAVVIVMAAMVALFERLNKKYEKAKQEI
jgi:hypothetical protein